VKKWQPGLLIVLLASALFIPFLGSTHLFDWDEVNFAEASREMIVTHNYFIPQINFEPFWEKPPLFFWLQVLSMKLFGVNEFAARFPNAVCGIITMLVLYRTGKKLVSPVFGWIWILVYAGSLLPQFYFKSGIIDPWFNVFIFLSVSQLFQYSEVRPSASSILLSGLFAGLAIMTKGPVALLIIGLCYAVHALLNRLRNFIKFKDILLFLLLAASVGSIWFIALWLKGEAYRHNNQIVPFVANDKSGGWFKLPHYSLKNIFFNALANKGEDWEHVIVTVFEQGKRPERCATWEEMCYIKAIFWEDDQAVMQIHPKKEDYITNHPYALHLWRPVKLEIPLPPSEMVGVKDLEVLKAFIEKLTKNPQ
jgi:4-amino-4-deoxy-L-arabinose transferase-like glycosyltransferase